MGGGAEGWRAREGGRERIRRAYEWISSYAAGAVWLKLRSDFTYRTPRPYTYVCPRGEIRKKIERKGDQSVFISGRVLLNVARIRDMTDRS